MTADKPRAELSIRVDVEEMRRAAAWLESASLERGVPPGMIARLDLCLHETLANIIDHGSAESTPICLQLDVEQDQSATVSVSHIGVAFDPLANPLKPPPKTLADAEPGGLGLHMIRKFSDSQSYRYNKGNNQFTFSVYWDKSNG